MLEKIHYRVFGQSTFPKLVFLHGLMGFSSNWGTIARKLVNNFNILVFDQRGHGRSHKPERGYRPEDYAQDLRAILEDLKWEKINLVGHSMGGRNAICFAANEPERVTRLVIEDIGPEAKPNSEQEFQSMLDQIPVPFISRQKAEEFFAQEFQLGGSTSHERTALIQYLMANLAPTEQVPGLLDWKFSLSAILETVREGRVRDRWDEFKRIRVPTLVIRGELSQELDSETLIQMARLNPMVRTAEVKGAGHWVHFEKPDEFVELICAFFSEDLSGRGGLKT